MIYTGRLDHRYYIHMLCYVSIVSIDAGLHNSIELMVSACTNTQSHMASVPPPPEMSTSV